jgi:hypothetical protein
MGLLRGKCLYLVQGLILGHLWPSIYLICTSKYYYTVKATHIMGWFPPSLHADRCPTGQQRNTSLTWRLYDFRTHTDKPLLCHLSSFNAEVEIHTGHDLAESALKELHAYAKLLYLRSGRQFEDKTSYQEPEDEASLDESGNGRDSFKNVPLTTLMRTFCVANFWTGCPRRFLRRREAHMLLPVICSTGPIRSKFLLR